jgi:putative aldouronate transport system substrate-binding protein
MQRNKTVLRGLLAMVLILSVFLQACSSNNGGNNQPTNTASSGQSQAAPEPDKKEPELELEPYEVLITYFGTPQEDDALVEEQLSKFFKEKINATVKLQPIASSDFRKRTELAMNTGEKMDLIFSASWLGFFSNITKGAYLELDGLLEQHGQGIKESLHPLYLEAPRLDGKLYAIPTNKEITQGKAFTYRKDIVEKYNIPIETINRVSDLEPWLEVIKKNEPDFIPYYIANGGGTPFLMYETNSSYRPVGPSPAATPMFFVDMDSNDINVKTLLDQEIDAVNKSEHELYRSFYEKGYINADSATSQTNVADYRRQGKIWVQTTVWKPGYDVIQEAADNHQFPYVSHVVEEPIVTTDLATGSLFAISRTSKDPERAMMVLNALHTDPYVINLIVNGIEGKHYKKVGDNRIEQIADSGYGKSALNWVIGNQLLNYLRPGEPDDMYLSWEKFNNEAKRFPLLGFVFNDSEVKNEITQLTSVVQEYNMIGSGALANPAKMLDERNGKLKSAGLEKVRDELQAQIDKWLASRQ